MCSQVTSTERNEAKVLANRRAEQLEEGKFFNTINPPRSEYLSEKLDASFSRTTNSNSNAARRSSQQSNMYSTYDSPILVDSTTSYGRIDINLMSELQKKNEYIYAMEKEKLKLENELQSRRSLEEQTVQQECRIKDLEEKLSKGRES